MSKRARTLLYVFVLLLFLGCIVLLLRSVKPDGFAKVYVLDVGQGDSVLLEAKNGRRILIDGGKNTKALSELSSILPAGDKRIDVVIATHTDADHIGGLPLILSRYAVGLFLTSEALSDTSALQELYAIVDKKKIPSYYVRHGMDVVLDTDPSNTSVFSILFPDRSTRGWNTNTASVIGKIQFGNRSALFTGDAPLSVENFLVKALPKELSVDILKLGHHGSKTSSSELFLSATRPILAIVSAGVGNSYGHPATEVVERISKRAIRMVSTQDSGTMVFKTDGFVWIE